MGLNVQRQFGTILFFTLDERPSNHRLVPPDDVLGRNDEGELERSDESEQEAFHPAEGGRKAVRGIEME